MQSRGERTAATECDDGGTYTLLVQVDERSVPTVGALGDVTLRPGWYAYTGSARGPGGFARVRRHREVATGVRDVRHWHVDSLLGLPTATIDLVTCSAVDAECAIADAVAGERVPGFGASDCDCEAHLAFAARRDHLLASVADAHERARERA